MANSEDNKGEIAPSFEEQIRHLRKARASKGTFLDKTTEHNVRKKLNRELVTKTRPLSDEILDKRLQQTLNREAESNMYAMFDSLTASLTGFKRRETKNFRAPVPKEETGSDSSYTPAPRLVARATKQYQAYTQSSDSAVAPAANITHSEASAGSGSASSGGEPEPPTDPLQTLQTPPSTPSRPSAQSLPSREEDMVLGSSTAAQSESGDSTDAHFIVGRSTINRSTQQHPHQIRTFPDGEKRIIEGSNFPSGIEQRPDAHATISHDSASDNIAQPLVQAQFEFNTEFIQEMAIFTAQTGLDLVMSSATSMQVLLTAAGTTTLLHEVPLNDSGIDEARILASSLLNFYLLALRDDFKIEFGHFGEIAIHQCGLNERNQLVPLKALFVRPPRLDELKAVQSALEYSWPSSAQTDDQLPLKIVFVNDVLLAGDNAPTRLKFGEDGRPVLFITPALCMQGVPTENDPQKTDIESWQLTIMRELSWKSLADCQKLPLSTDDCETMGWIEVSRDANLYILCTANGEYYYPNPDPQTPEQAWLRVNRSGEYVNEHGQKIAQSSEIIFKTAEQIAAIAKVKPAGIFFHSPEEELADALAKYRLGAEEKARMLDSSPTLYALTKRIDQLSINRWYNPTKNYEGQIRSVSGALVDHTPENLRAVLEFEHSKNRH